MSDLVLVIQRRPLALNVGRQTVSLQLGRQPVSLQSVRVSLSLNLNRRPLVLAFPNCVARGVTLPDDADTGDVLTYDGSAWIAAAPGTSASIETRTAGENLSSGRVVVIQGGEAFYFQPSDVSHGGRAWGITVTSATAGNDVTIQREGVVTDAAFSGFSDEALYVGTDGELQTSWPGAGLLQKAGISAGANKVKIDFSVQVEQA